jgi:hypothetical protein
MAPALLVVGTGYLLCLGGRSPRRRSPELARWLESHQLTSGLAPYWQAESAMLASGGRIQLAPMAASGLTAVRGGWETRTGSTRGGTRPRSRCRHRGQAG